MEKTINVSVDLNRLEGAAISAGILAGGLGRAFEDSLATMNSKSREDMQEWFSANYDNLNGALDLFTHLFDVIGEALETVNLELSAE